MKSFDKHFSNMTRGLEDHQFKHYNHALGCYIYSKEHYKHEMKKQGQVPQSMAEEMREDWEKRNPNREYKTSKKCHQLINHMTSQSKSNNGMIRLGDHPKVVKEMESMGMSFDMDKLDKMINQ